MRHILPCLCAALAFVAIHAALAQEQLDLISPKSIVAGSAFSIQSSGSGTAALYIVGPDQVLERSLQLGTAVSFPAASLNNAGDYVVILSGDSRTRTASLEVLPQTEPAKISLLARPSRLPVDVSNAITGAAYVFDSYRNLIVTPIKVSFELSSPSGAKQSSSAVANDGAAWTEMNSTSSEGDDRFVAHAGRASVEREIRQVPGNPCQLTMTAQQSGNRLELQTAPIHDCSGNIVADGTIVTFTETYDGGQSTADVPVKRGIAKVEMPDYRGAMLSVASGVVLGNQIRWEK